MESTEFIIIHLDTQMGLMAKYLDEEIFTDELLLGLWDATLHVSLPAFVFFRFSLLAFLIEVGSMMDQ